MRRTRNTGKSHSQAAFNRFAIGFAAQADNGHWKFRRNRACRERRPFAEG
jgi:hypothetical protein